MENKGYSVVIRTLGTAGEKYGELLRSIEEQTINPNEVVIVMAEGYEPAPYHTANERIVYTHKGMVNQRQVGFEEARCPYMLVVDDDIKLAPDFAEKTLQCMENYGADAVFTGGDERIGGGKIILHNIRNVLLAERRYSNKQSPYYLRIGWTGGTVVNSGMKEGERYLCQTANFQCFAMRRSAALDVHFEEEMWLEDTGYAWPDDRVFFYKAFLKGYKIYYEPNTSYKNLDAKSGKVTSQDKTFWDFYTHERNITIFWRRFIYANAEGLFNKISCVLCFGYRCIAASVLYVVKCIVRRKPSALLKWHKGYTDAKRFLSRK